jgi:SAM-dependent methyltransferase
MANRPEGWEWDQSLYAGAAQYYQAGRMPYPAELGDVLAGALGLDGTGRLLDVGCGPGPLTILLAPLFASAVGLDASTGMIAAARAQAKRTGASSISWRRLRAEEITSGLGEFRVVTFAQSFHWVDGLKVARLVRTVLEPDGACVIVHATTHQGAPGEHPLPLPRPPRAEIDLLISDYLGSVRRAGQGTRAASPPRDAAADSGAAAAGAGYADDVFADAGFTGPAPLVVQGGSVAERDEDEVVASVFSLSYAAPHLFGADRARFEQDLRALLRRTAPDGRFCEERMHITAHVWRPAAISRRARRLAGT